MVLRGLNTATLNGARGTAVDFSFSERGPGAVPGIDDWVTASGQYTVQLDGQAQGGRLVKVRAVHVAKGR